jgi:hypothetical protein
MIKLEVLRWLIRFGPYLCCEGVNNLIARWNKCHNEQGGTDVLRIITVRLKIFSQKLARDALLRNGVKDFVKRCFPYCNAACHLRN